MGPAGDKKAAKVARNAGKQAAERVHVVVKMSRELSNKAFESAYFKNAQTRQHIYLSDIERKILAKWAEVKVKPWTQTIQ